MYEIVNLTLIFLWFPRTSSGGKSSPHILKTSEVTGAQNFPQELRQKSKKTVDSICNKKF